MTPSPSFITTFDDTLPILPGFSPAPSSTGNPALGVAGTSQPVTVSPSSGGFTSFFGTRGIAIILGLIFIGGSILLFLGDDIAGAVKIAAKVTT